MPLTFSGNQETQDLNSLQGRKVAEMNVKNYNSCLIESNDSSGGLDSSFEILNTKSDDSSPGFTLDRNSRSGVYTPDDIEEDSIVETTALRHPSESSKIQLTDSNMTDNYLTVSGTIKRGKKKGQSVEVVLNMSREELEILEANMTSKHGCQCNGSSSAGFHIFLWTVLCFPFSLVISGVYSFCMGTITWYNIFKLFSEKKAMGYRILVPPLLIVLYPFLIISISLGLGVYAGVKQLSCYWNSWQKEFMDYEKGFYGWLCNSLDVPECSPYEVVILSSIQKP